MRPVAVALGLILALALAAPAWAAPGAPRVRERPRITGTAVQGSVLRATRGRWSHADAFRLRWLSCGPSGRHCRRIAGASHRRHRVRAADVGRRLRVRVTALRHVRRGHHRRVLRTTARSRATALVRAPQAAPGPGPTPPTTPTFTPAPPGSAGLHVAGNALVDTTGKAVQLRGVNYPGTEYACVQGWGIFDHANSVDPDLGAIAAGIRSWHANAVRVPLNEQCWLGINGLNPDYSGASYQAAIRRWVDAIHAHGMVAELSLIWAAPGTQQAGYQPEAPDADHSPAFWASLAAAYKGVPDVILAPWGETTVNADCFLNGGCTATFGPTGTYTTAGMQQAVDVMRGAGYTGPIAIPGVDYANDLTKWLSHEPGDPLHQLVAEAHVYGGNSCDTAACLDSTMAPVAARVPLIFGETGETYDGNDCSSTVIAPIVGWADAHGVGYEFWHWNPWGDCLDLITGFDGTPADSDYARWVRDHLLASG